MPYAVTPTAIPYVLMLESKMFGDSRTTKGVLRGLHYQLRQPQGRRARGARSGV